MAALSNVHRSQVPEVLPLRLETDRPNLNHLEWFITQKQPAGYCLGKLNKANRLGRNGHLQATLFLKRQVLVCQMGVWNFTGWSVCVCVWVCFVMDCKWSAKWHYSHRTHSYWGRLRTSRVQQEQPGSCGTWTSEPLMNSPETTLL